MTPKGWIGLITSLSLLLLSSSAIQATANTQQDDRVEITVLTLSCVKQDDVQHVFPFGLGDPFSEDTRALLVVGHDLKLSRKRYERQFLHVERAAVFAHNGRPGDNFTMRELHDTLSGRITDWSTLERGSGKIAIYLHGGRLQRQAVQTVLMGQLKITPDELKEVNIRYIGDEDRDPDDTYQKLHSAAARDPNSLVIGLSGLMSEGLKIQKVDGQEIADRKSKYPLSIETYLYWQDTSEGRVARMSYLDAVRDRIKKRQAKIE